MKNFFTRGTRRHGDHGVLFLLILCVLSASVSSVRIYSQHISPYLIPRQIFVGDTAALIIPLSTPTTANISATTNLPAHNYIDFHKITLETNRLIIEFTAFAPGELELPIIEIGGHYFPNLSITVNSVIDRKNAISLSAPASSLAMPGTAILLYGLMAGIIFVLLLTIWFTVKGKSLMSAWKEKWKKLRLFANIRHMEKRLHKAVKKGTDKRKILDALSQAFRNFLSIFTGLNCRAMTAEDLNAQCTMFNAQLDFAFIGKCDNLRFSGNEVSEDNIHQLLNDLRNFIDILEQSEEKNKSA